jgi:hypothetical protein
MNSDPSKHPEPATTRRGSISLSRVVRKPSAKPTATQKRRALKRRKPAAEKV